MINLISALSRGDIKDVAMMAFRRRVLRGHRIIAELPSVYIVHATRCTAAHLEHGRGIEGDALEGRSV